MNKPANREEIIQQLKQLPLEDREIIAAGLLENIHDDESIARARAAVGAVRARTG